MGKIRLFLCRKNKLGFHNNEKKSKKRFWFLFASSLLFFFVTTLTLTLPLVKSQNNNANEILNFLKNYNAQVNSNLQNEEVNNIFDPNTGKRYDEDSINEFANSFEQSKFEVDQATTQNTLSNLGFIKEISFVNLQQEGYYNLISELHPVDIYGRYIPFKIDRTWTKQFWADDFLIVDPDGPMLGPDLGEDIWAKNNFDLQMEVFENALQDMDYGFTISENSELFKKLEYKYGKEYVERFQATQWDLDHGNWSQMVGNSSIPNIGNTDDKFSYKTSFRIILETPAVIDHIEISMPRYMDSENNKIGTIGIESLVMTDIFNNNFETTINNEDFNTNGVNFANKPGQVITVPYLNPNLDAGDLEKASSTFADVWWNKLYIGGIYSETEKEWVIERANNPLSSLSGDVINSDIMDGYNSRQLTLKIPRGYVPIFVNTNSDFGLIDSEGNLKNIPLLSLVDQNLAKYKKEIQIGTLYAQAGEEYKLFFLKTTFNIFEEFSYQNSANIKDYLVIPKNNSVAIPEVTNMNPGFYQLDYAFLQGVQPIFGLMPYFTVINWDAFELPKDFYNNKNVVYARYKTEYDSSWDRSYFNSEWTYVNLDETTISNIWLQENSIITIEFYAKNNYNVVNSINKEEAAFSFQYKIPEWSLQGSLSSIEYPSLFSDRFVTSDNIINTKDTLENLGSVTDLDITFKTTFEWNNDYWSSYTTNRKPIISELNFLDSRNIMLPYNVTYYSSDEGNIDGSAYSREQYMRISRLLNDGDVTLDSFWDDNWQFPFSVDNSVDSELGVYYNYGLGTIKNNRIVRVKINFDTPVVLSKIKLGGGSYWTEDVPSIVSITATKSDGRKFSTLNNNTARRLASGTNINGDFLGNAMEDYVIYHKDPQGNTLFLTKKRYEEIYYGISSLVWVEEENYSFSTSDSLTSLGAITGGIISFWGQFSQIDSMGISGLKIYDEIGNEIKYKITKTNHLDNINHDIANPVILEEKQWLSLVDKTGLNNDKGLYYSAPMSALITNWYFLNDEITIDKDADIYINIIGNFNYNEDYLAAFNFINSMLTRPNYSYKENWDNLVLNFSQVFKGEGSKLLLNRMQQLIEQLQSSDGQAQVIIPKNENNSEGTFNYGDVTFDNLIVGFGQETLHSAVKKVYNGLKGVELSQWGANNLEDILQDNDINTTITTSGGWLSWDEFFEYDNLSLLPYSPYLDIAFEFADGKSHKISKIEVESNGLDSLMKTTKDEQGKAPRRIDLTLNSVDGNQYSANYIKPTNDRGEDFDLSSDKDAISKYHVATFGLGTIDWAETKYYVGSKILFNQFANLDSNYSSSLFAQVWNTELKIWESIDSYEIKNEDEFLNTRIGFYYTPGLQGTFPNGNKWLKFTWDIPKISKREIEIKKELPSEIDFEGIDGFGTFDLNSFKWSINYDVLITIYENDRVVSEYYNDMPLVLKNGQSISVALIPKNGFIFVDGLGNSFDSLSQKYVVNDLKEVESINFNQKINFNILGNNGSGTATFNTSLIPEELSWKIRVVRNEIEIAVYENVFPTNLFKGDIVYLDIFSKKGYLINNEKELLSYSFAKVENLNFVNPIPLPTETSTAIFKNLVFTARDSGLYLDNESIANIQKWFVDNPNINVNYSITIPGVLSPIQTGKIDHTNEKTIAISLEKILVQRNYNLSFTFTPDNAVFVSGSNSEKDDSTAPNTAQFYTVQIAIISDGSSGMLFEFDENLVNLDLNFVGGNNEASLFFSSNVYKYLKLYNFGLDVKIYLMRNETVIKEENFKMNEKIFSTLKNGDKIKIVASLPTENDRWVDPKTGEIFLPTNPPKILEKTIEVKNLLDIVLKEPIPEINLNLEGYEGNNSLTNLENIEFTGSPTNTLLYDYDNWIKRNPEVFVGVYLLRGNDKDRIKDLVLRDPKALPYFDPATGEGYRLDPNATKMNFKNGDEILYYVVPKGENQLLYGNQSYFIFNYKIDDLLMSLPMPGLFTLNQDDFYQVLYKTSKGAQINDFFDSLVIQQDFNDITFTINFYENGLITNTIVVNSIADLKKIDYLSDGTSINIEARPQPGYFWGTDINGQNAYYANKTYFVYLGEITGGEGDDNGTNLPSDIDDIASLFEFEGLDGTGFISNLKLDFLELYNNHINVYVKIFNEENEKLYLWPATNLIENDGEKIMEYLLNNPEFHHLKNGYFASIVFRTTKGYIFIDDGSTEKETKKIKVHGLKYSIWDYGVTPNIIEGFDGLDGSGQMSLADYNTDAASISIEYWAPGASDYSMLKDFDEIYDASSDKFNHFANGGKVRITIRPNHDDDFVVDYEKWKEETSKIPYKEYSVDFYQTSTVIMGLNKPIDDDYIEKVLKDNLQTELPINLDQLLFNRFPKGYTRYNKDDINNGLKATNDRFEYYLYVYDSRGSIVEKISIYKLLRNSGKIRLENGFTVKLFGVAKNGYSFNNGTLIYTKEKDFSEWVKPINYGSEEGKINIPLPVIINNFVFYVNQEERNIKKIVFDFNLSNIFQDNNIIINTIANFNSYFNVSISTSKSKLSIDDFTFEWDESAEKLILKPKNGKVLKVDDQITITFSLDNENDYKFINIDASYQARLEDQYSVSLKIDFAKNILEPKISDQLIFVDNNNISQLARIDLNETIFDLGNLNLKYNYTINIFRNGVWKAYPVSSSTLDTDLPTLEIGDRVKILAEILPEYQNEYAFSINQELTHFITLYDKVLDNKDLVLKITIPDYDNTTLNFQGPSGYASLSTNLFGIDNVKISLEVLDKNNKIIRTFKSMFELSYFNNFTNGMKLRIKIDTIFENSDLTLANGTVLSGDDLPYLYTWDINNLKKPVSIPNFNDQYKSVTFNFGSTGSVEMKFLWDNIFVGGFENALNSDQILFSVQLWENAYKNNLKFEYTYNYTGDFTTRLQAFLKQINDSHLLAEGNILTFTFKTEGNYEFIPYEFIKNGKIEQDVKVEEIAKFSVELNDIPNKLSYQEDHNVESIAQLDQIWIDWKNEIGKFKNIKFTFTIYRDNQEYKKFDENTLPENDLKNGDIVQLIIEVKDSDLYYFSYQEMNYSKLEVQYLVSDLNKIAKKPSFPDKLSYSGFVNNVNIQIGNDYENVKLYYYVSKDGGKTFSNPTLVPPIFLENGYVIKLGYQTNDGYVFYDEEEKLIYTTTTSGNYEIQDLKYLLNYEFQDSAIFTKNNNKYINQDYNNEKIVVKYRYWNKYGEEQPLATELPKDFNFLKGIDIVFEILDKETYTFGDYSSSKEKHFEIGYFGEIFISDFNTDSLFIPNKDFSNTFIFNWGAFPYNKNYSIKVFDVFNQEVPVGGYDLTKIPPNYRIELNINPKINTFYLLNSIKDMSLSITVPNLPIIDGIDLSALDNLTFKGPDGHGTIVITPELDALFKNKNLRFTFKVIHNGQTITYPPSEIPHNLSNGDRLKITVSLNRVNVNKSLTYFAMDNVESQDNDFEYQVFGLISEEIIDKKNILDIVLFSSIAFIALLFSFFVYISFRKVRQG